MSVTTPQIPSSNGEPAWEAAYMLPVQGSWSEEDFYAEHGVFRMSDVASGLLLPALRIDVRAMFNA